MTQLEDWIHDLGVLTAQCGTRVGSNPGPLSQTDQDYVEPRLDDSVLLIADCVSHADLNAYTGNVENAYSTSSLPSIAGDCVALAQYADLENKNRGAGWQQRCVNHLATIDYLINAASVGYYARAGI